MLAVAMPIVDVEIVGGEAGRLAAQPLADALGAAFSSPPGRTWLRLRFLAADAYAENGGASAPDPGPVFVTVLHAHPPQGDALGAELAAIGAAVAEWCGRPPERVHVQYGAAGAGRQAFGGRLVS
jgi:hypothetical protein